MEAPVTRTHIWSCRSGIILFALLCASSARAAEALPSLAQFLAGARQYSSDVAIAEATVEQQMGESLASLGRALPSFTARGVYTRNEYQQVLSTASFGVSLPGVPATSIAIQQYNQLNGTLQVDAPIIDLNTWAKLWAQRSNQRVSEKRTKTTLLDVQKTVARYYYQLIGAEALRASAERSLNAAETNLALTKDRRDLGVVTDVDVYRAETEVERNRRSISDAELTAHLARRALRTFTGIDATGDTKLPVDDLHPEPSFDDFARGSSHVPAVAVASEQRRNAELSSLAAKLALAPTVVASGQELFTNAAGFTGHYDYYVLTLTLAWKLDVTTFGNIKAQGAAAEVNRLKENAARQTAYDTVYESWLRVANNIAKTRSARSEARSATSAVQIARERHKDGSGTELELIQAERDAFAAATSSIQADADLSYARAVLRLDSGRPLDEEKLP